VLELSVSLVDDSVLEDREDREDRELVVLAPFVGVM
jgi:hypothetical protein